MYSGFHPDAFWRDQANDSTSCTAEMSSVSETSSPAAERPLPKKSEKVNVEASRYEDLSRQMNEMKENHKKQVESQQMEIQDLQAQLRALKTKGGE